jgi:hypothetical protein
MQETFKPSISAPQGQSPLLHFKAVLEDYVSTQREFDREDGSKRQAVAIEFRFKDLEVLDATEPYPFPIAVISLNYSPPSTSRGGTRWEALAKSIRQLFPGDDSALDKMKGQKQEWKMLPATLRQPLTEEDGTPKVDGNGRAVWGDAPGTAWQVVSVDGVAGPEDLTDYVVGLAEGKTEQQFHQALLTDPKIISRPDLVSNITERKLLDSLVTAGKVSRDAEGVLHSA